LDGHGYRIATAALQSRGVKFLLYQRILTGQTARLEYTFFSRAHEKYAGEIAELSLKKIQALRDHVPYELAKAVLGVSGEFHVTIRRIGGAVILDYGPTIPAETERSDREVFVEGVRCTVTVDIW